MDKQARLDRTAPRFCVLLTLLVLVALLAGCGGERDDDPTTSTSSTPTTAEADSLPSQQVEDEPPQKAEAAAGKPPASDETGFRSKPHEVPGGGSDQFKVKGGDNSIQEFGDEAAEADLRQAAEALHGFLDARAQRAWAAACSYLSGPMVESLEKLPAPEGNVEGCPAALAALAGRVPDAALAEEAEAEVGSLRFEGPRGYLIYRGPRETVYAIPMAAEDGQWKVGAMAGLPLS